MPCSQWALLLPVVPHFPCRQKAVRLSGPTANTSGKDWAGAHLAVPQHAATYGLRLLGGERIDEEAITSPEALAVGDELPCEL
jgi:hypothetical protein